jgi:hypothetical protein
MQCPFCDDSGFDAIGLKHHLVTGYCEMFNSTISVEEERRARQSNGSTPKQPTTTQGQNGTAGKPQVWECTTSAIA